MSRSDGSLRAWIVFPDGGVVAGATAGPYAGLGTLQGGLGVERIAGTRGPQLKGQERQRLDAGRDADVIDATDADAVGSPISSAAQASATTRLKSIRKRQEVLADAAATLLPGDIRQVLAAGEGRLLVVPGQGYRNGAVRGAADPQCG